jgi:PPIC-type PPIASE domain
MSEPTQRISRARPAGRTTRMGGRLVTVAVVAVSGSMTLSSCDATRARTVASVQGRPITQAQLAHWIRVENAQTHGSSTEVPVPEPPTYSRCVAAAGAAQSQSASPRRASTQELRRQCAQTYARLRKKALAFLITADWLQGEAAAQGISVSASEVYARYQQQVNGPAGQVVATRLKRDGMSPNDELLELRLEILGQKLTAKIAAGYKAVSAARIAAYYRAHPRQSASQPSRRVFLVVTRTIDAARSAKRQLQHGVVPASVARRFSADPTVRSTGGVTTLSRGAANPTLERAVFHAPLRTLAGPVAVPSAGFYLFRVLSSEPRRRETLFEATPAIRQTLLQAGRQQQVNAFIAFYRQRWKRRTVCQSGYVIAECRNGLPLTAAPTD